MAKCPKCSARLAIGSLRIKDVMFDRVEGRTFAKEKYFHPRCWKPRSTSPITAEFFTGLGDLEQADQKKITDMIPKWNEMVEKQQQEKQRKADRALEKKRGKRSVFTEQSDISETSTTTLESDPRAAEIAQPAKRRKLMTGPVKDEDRISEDAPKLTHNTLLSIFQFLPPVELGQCLLVDHAWSKAVLEPKRWRDLCYQQWTEATTEAYKQTWQGRTRQSYPHLYFKLLSVTCQCCNKISAKPLSLFMGQRLCLYRKQCRKVISKKHLRDFGIAEEDVEALGLACEERPNPHNPKFAPSRVYLEYEIQNAGRKKRELTLKKLMRTQNLEPSTEHPFLQDWINGVHFANLRPNQILPRYLKMLAE
eukprot:GILK01006661.1.p1 GENE.GILK01006661.1~~GILK01006661.1.p1  ORF type:complete len:398 (+),score=38.95 GILK01006661.1:104-1195(+)